MLKFDDMFKNSILLVLMLGFHEVSLSTDDATSMKAIGTFQNLEFGDYLYLNIMDGKGNKQVFYCNMPKCAEWEANQASFEKKKVLVKWSREKMFFKETSTTKIVRAVRSLDLAK
jgi:hypothetical protein